MAFFTFPTTPVPDGEINHEITPAMDILRFGEGYTSRWVRGINATLSRYGLRWTNLTAAERNALFNFVKSLNGGAAFTYKFLTDPLPRTFIAPDGLRETRKNGDFYDVEISFEEVNDLGSGDPVLSDIEDWIPINRGEPLNHEMQYQDDAVPANVLGWTFTLEDSSNAAAFANMAITVTDVAEGIVTLTMSAPNMAAISDGRVDWFRIRATYPGGLYDVTQKIGIEIT